MALLRKALIGGTSDKKSNLSAVEHQTEISRKKGTIWQAILKADQSALEHLLREDPNNISVRGPVGECPIHMLFLYGSEAHLDMARYLILRFPPIVMQFYNEPEYYGETILHIAIIKRNVAMVEWLLGDEHNLAYRQQQLAVAANGNFFKIGQPCYYGESPLAFACCTNQWNIVEILLKYGASMDVTDSNGNTILHLLVIHNLPEIYSKFKTRWLQMQEIMNSNESIDYDKSDLSQTKTFMMKKTPLWKRLNKDGVTPLSLAAQLGQVEMFSFLLDERKITQWSYGPVSCVLYPLDQLDIGLEKEDQEAQISALELIVKHAHVELIILPRVIDLIDKKWQCFARRIFFRRFMATLTYLIIFLIATILDQTRIEITEGEGESMVVVSVEYPSVTLDVICIIGHFIILAGACWMCKIVASEIASIGFKKYLHSMSSSGIEDGLMFAFSISIIILNILRLLEMPEQTSVLALSSILGWSYMLCLIMAFRFTGPFVVIIYKMLFNDVLRFCIIYLVFLVGFSQAFFVLFNKNGFSGFILTVKQCFFGMLGDFDSDDYFGYVCFSLLITYVIVVTILLLNLLIAMMGDTYGNVIENATHIWHLQRARIVFTIEKKLSKQQRDMESNKYWTIVDGERYLQVQEVNNKCFRDTT